MDLVPNDVVTEILLRLPAKSLGRCKCVCTTWNNLIQNPNFVENHFHHPGNPTRLSAFYTDDTGTNHHSVLTDNFLSQQLEYPKSSSFDDSMEIKTVLGPVDGLYFLNYRNEAKNEYQFLWNPSTTEFRQLLLLPFFCKTGDSEYDCMRFGFGSTGTDVKVVLIHQFRSSLNCRRTRNEVVTVYSLKDDCWKDTEYDAKFSYIDKTYPYLCTKSIFVNKACYWRVGSCSKDYDSIMLFDMIHDNFRELNVPSLSENASIKKLLVRESASIVLYVEQHILNNHSTYSLESVNIWEMKEEEGREWLLLVSFDPSSSFVGLDPFPYRFRNKDEIIIQANDDKVVSYNIYSLEIRDLKVDGFDITFLDYKESLTSVRGRSARACDKVK